MLQPSDIADMCLGRINRALGQEKTTETSKRIAIDLISLFSNELTMKRAKFYKRVIKSIRER